MHRTSIALAVVFAAALASVAGSCRASTMEGLVSGGLQRVFYVHVPPTYQTGHPMPLVIVYHGSGDTGAGIEDHIGLDAVADKLGFITVYPDGIDHSWASHVADQADAAGVDDVAFTAALLDRLELQYSIDKSRVVAAGFSNGAHLVHLLGCELADRISAIVPIGGTLTKAVDCDPARPITVMEFHDVYDPVVPYLGGRVGIGGAAQAWDVDGGLWHWATLDKCQIPANGARYPATGQVHFGVRDYGGCSGGVAVRLYMLDYRKHAWPTEPDASALIGKIATGKL